MWSESDMKLIEIDWSLPYSEQKIKSINDQLTKKRNETQKKLVERNWIEHFKHYSKTKEWFILMYCWQQ